MREEDVEDKPPGSGIKGNTYRIFTDALKIVMLPISVAKEGADDECLK